MATTRYIAPTRTTEIRQLARLAHILHHAVAELTNAEPLTNLNTSTLGFEMNDKSDDIVTIYLAAMRIIQRAEG